MSITLDVPTSDGKSDRNRDKDQGGPEVDRVMKEFEDWEREQEGEKKLKERTDERNS